MAALRSAATIGGQPADVSNSEQFFPCRRRNLSRGKWTAYRVNLENTTMHLSSQSLLIILLVGLVAGWLAGQIVQGTGFGIIGDIVIGVLGAFIGSWLFPQLGIHLGAGILSAIINATIGALLLLLIIRLVRGGGGSR